MLAGEVDHFLASYDDNDDDDDDGGDDDDADNISMFKVDLFPVCGTAPAPSYYLSATPSTRRSWSRWPGGSLRPRGAGSTWRSC